MKNILREVRKVCKHYFRSGHPSKYVGKEGKEDKVIKGYWANRRMKTIRIRLGKGVKKND